MTTPTLVQMAGIVQHSSKSNEHYTPPQIVEPARATLGQIDLDPCSCKLAQEVVQAKYWLGTNTLFVNWRDTCHDGRDGPARVLLNPPGGLLHPETLLPCKPGTHGAKSSLAVYWCKLWNEWQSGNVSQAIFVCFNLEVLRTTQDESLGCAPALDFPICYFKERPRYWNAETPPALRGKHGAPSHPGAVVYLPERHDAGGYGIELDRDGIARFTQAFAPLGKIVIPVNGV
jgi:hypothetical protein